MDVTSLRPITAPLERHQALAERSLDCFFRTNDLIAGASSPLDPVLQAAVTQARQGVELLEQAYAAIPEHGYDSGNLELTKQWATEAIAAIVRYDRSGAHELLDAIDERVMNDFDL